MPLDVSYSNILIYLEGWIKSKTLLILTLTSCHNRSIAVSLRFENYNGKDY
jgi:hypothetical protein